jgi:branched-chain amino acid transport system substrate-binding protein
MKQQIGKYEIRSEIGSGGMGKVYKAYDPALDILVAIKVLKLELARKERFVKRFMREARSAARLDHAGLVTIYGAGQNNEQYYFVMQYLEGQPLDDLVRWRGVFSSDEVISILRPLAEALDYAHRNGFVHRDVKPGNIIVGPDGKAKLTDFGIVHAAQETSLTETGTVLGTPRYMSPEQAKGTKKVDGRSDQYSLAVVAYEMLAGRVPFLADNTLALLHKIVYDSPPPLRPLRPDLPRQVDKVLSKAMAKDPEERYPSTSAFVEDLEEALDKEPSSVPAWTWALGGVAAIALVVGIVMAVTGGGGNPLTSTEEAMSQAVEGTNTPVEAAAVSSTDTPRPTSAKQQPTATPMPTAPPPSPTPAPKAVETFKLGVLGPFSGPSARTGEEFKASATMALEKIDYQIGHYEIDPVWIDSQSDPAKAAQAYEQAVVQDDIQAGILNWHSSVAVDVMELTAEYQIPHFCGLGATEVVNETWRSNSDKYFYWVNKWWPVPRKLGENYVKALEYAIEEGAWQPESKTVAIYGEDTGWGRSFSDSIAEQFRASGWEVVGTEYFPYGQTEFYSLLNEFEDLNPAVIAGTSTGISSLSAFIRQADEVGLDSLIIVDGLGWYSDWYESTGPSSDYVLDQIIGWATQEGKQFAQDFELRKGFDPTTAAAGLAYDGAGFFIQVAQQVYEDKGELSAETLADFAKNEIQSGNWSYTDGIIMKEYKYTPETAPDPVMGPGYYIFPVRQYFKGDSKIIFPPEWVEQELRAKP